jgi:hypothetical protein
MSITPANPQPNHAVDFPGIQAASSNFELSKRYADSYRIANFQTGLGDLIKKVAGICGFIIFFGGLCYAGSSATPQPGFFGPGANMVGVVLGIFGMIIGAAVAGVGFILGILVSSDGQILKATLDTAVCSNPFLNDNDRAAMMTL